MRRLRCAYLRAAQKCAGGVESHQAGVSHVGLCCEIKKMVPGRGLKSLGLMLLTWDEERFGS